MTANEAMALKLGKVVYDKIYRNKDGSPLRWKVNGAVKRWVRKPDNFKVPIKRGLYEHGYITPENVMDFELKEESAIANRA